jgi:pyrimidine-nucleoside phosphorylase
MTLSMVPLIEHKKRGGRHSEDELTALCRALVAGSIPDFQIAAWLMAVCWRGMDAEETLAFTRAMVATGDTLEWSRLGRAVADKHSTGGVGDKTSLVLVPLIAAAGIPLAKMSGRSLGHTGGTIDKLESISGFHAELSPQETQSQVERIGCAMVAQSGALVPADKLLYALRDVTGTVDSLPLIAASIMSKKLAAGAHVIVLDVKYGSGAFMQSRAEALSLARLMVSIGEGAGRRTRAVVSEMEEPLGRAVGNALEVREAIDTLHGAGPDDLRELTLALGTEILVLAGRAARGGPDSPAPHHGRDEERAELRARLVHLLDTGAAAAAFERMIEAQGGDPGVVAHPERLPSAELVHPLRSPGRGSAWVAAVDARKVGETALDLGAGRRSKGETLHLGTGIVLHKKTGDETAPGDTIATIHARTEAEAMTAAERLLQAFTFRDEPVPAPHRDWQTIAASGEGSPVA